MATKPNTATALENARKALAQIEQEADGLVAARDKVLLDGAPTSEAIQINKQIDATRRAVEAEQRRVHLLEQRVAQEEVEAAARRQEVHVREFADTLAEADKAGDELQAAVATMEKKFRETIRLRELAYSMWPHGKSSHGDAVARAPDGCALVAGAVATLLAHELHRVGTGERLGGSPGERVVIPLPAPAPPRLTPLVDMKTKRPIQPEPLGAVLRNASRFAVETLRGDRFKLPPEPQPEPPGPPMGYFGEAPAPHPSGVPALGPAAVAAPPQPAAVVSDIDPLREYIPPRFREQLAGLLREQMRLAASGDDRAYEKCLADVAALRAKIDAAREGDEAA